MAAPVSPRNWFKPDVRCDRTVRLSRVAVGSLSDMSSRQAYEKAGFLIVLAVTSWPFFTTFGRLCLSWTKSDIRTSSLPARCAVLSNGELPLSLILSADMSSNVTYLFKFVKLSLCKGLARNLVSASSNDAHPQKLPIETPPFRWMATTSCSIYCFKPPYDIMEFTASKALVRRRTDTELMPPPPKRIKRPQKVLDEETYTDGISHIIARDFFPGLLESETQSEYLDALDSRDQAWISSAGRRLAHVMTPGRQRGRRGTSVQTAGGLETPIGNTGDTPMSARSEYSATTTEVDAKDMVDTNMSLDAFQSKYTSEDNESFYKLLDKQNKKRAEKYAWMWRGNKLPSKQMLKQKEVETKLLEGGRSLVDDGGERRELAIRDVVEKPAMPDSWKSKPENNLMFGPEGVDDVIETVAQNAQTASRAAPKGVVYSNTRMPALVAIGEPEVPPSPSLSAIRDAIAGRPRPTDSEPGYNGSETPRVNGYAFVDEDEPELEQMGDYSPTIVLGRGDATPNPFKIKEQSKREGLHHRMVDRVARTKRASSQLGMTGKVDMTPVPKFPSSPRIGSGGLTPAAQRLWSRVGTSAPASPGFDIRTPGTAKSRPTKLKVGWTPK